MLQWITTCSSFEAGEARGAARLLDERSRGAALTG